MHMIDSRRRVWLLGGLLCAGTTITALTTFNRHQGQWSMFALADWLLIALFLVMPLAAIYRSYGHAGEERSRIHQWSVQIVVLAYLPLWAALRMLDRVLRGY